MIYLDFCNYLWLLTLQIDLPLVARMLGLPLIGRLGNLIPGGFTILRLFYKKDRPDSTTCAQLHL